MKHVLIDSDVLMDFFLDREPHSEHSSKILQLCDAKMVKGYVSPVIISNLYYLLRKLSTHHRVVEKLRQLLIIVDVVQMNRSSVMAALNSNFKDFEDAMQNMAAIQNNKIKVIITRNVKDYKQSSLGVMTPIEYVKNFL